MADLDRPDIIEGKRLENHFDLESISFEDARWLFHDFINEILISKKLLEGMGVTPDTITKAIYYN
jgi:hypothetical protein